MCKRSNFYRQEARMEEISLYATKLLIENEILKDKLHDKDKIFREQAAKIISDNKDFKDALREAYEIIDQCDECNSKGGIEWRDKYERLTK